MPLVLDGTNGVSGVDGTASNPAIEGTDSNTGIFYPAADTVAIGTGGTEALRVNSSQNVGIGTSSPGSKLTVSGDIQILSTNYLSFSNTAQQTYIRAAASSTLAFGTNSTEQMRLDSSGNVGIGTNSPSTYAGKLTVLEGYITAAHSTSASYINWYSGGAALNQKYWRIGTSSGALLFETVNDAYTTPTERARIDSSGNLLVGEASQTWDERLSAKRTTNAVVGGFYSSATTYTSSVIRAQTEAAAGTGWILFEGRSATGVGRINIYGNGNIQNTNGSYGTLSDIKLKENIVDATPKLEQLQQIRIVNFNLIGDTQKQIGVIAQELEEVFPGLVEDIVDRDDEGNDLGTVTKSVKTSVFVPMLIKAIQEQQAMIDELKAKVAALENA